MDKRIAIIGGVVFLVIFGLITLICMGSSQNSLGDVSAPTPSKYTAERKSNEKFIRSCFSLLAKQFIIADNGSNTNRILSQLALSDIIFPKYVSRKITIFIPYGFNLSSPEVDRTYAESDLKDTACVVTTNFSYALKADAIVFKGFKEDDAIKWNISRNNQVWIYNMLSVPDLLKENSNFTFDWISSQSLLSHIPYSPDVIIDSLNEETIITKRPIVIAYKKLYSDKITNFLTALKNEGIDLIDIRCPTNESKSCGIEGLKNILKSSSNETKFILDFNYEIVGSANFIESSFYTISSYPRAVPVILDSSEEFYKKNLPYNSYYRLNDLSGDSAKKFADTSRKWRLNTGTQVVPTNFYKRLCAFLHSSPTMPRIKLHEPGTMFNNYN